MKMAAAQITPTQNVETNVRKHIDMIKLAAEAGVSLLVFPEMSLTGYERERASDVCFEDNDSRLETFASLAMKHNMMIIAGAPVKSGDNLYIGSLIFCGDGVKHLYTKQFLHAGEEEYFVPCNSYNPLIQIHNEKVSFAICADITHQEHIENAHNKNSSLYVASIFYTPGGIEEAYEQLNSYAKKYRMRVIMANYAQTSYGFPSAGRSACWNANGNLLGCIPDDREGLLIVSDNDEVSVSYKLMTEAYEY